MEKIGIKIHTEEQVVNNLELINNLQLILDKEPKFFEALSDAIGHLAKTYEEKYEATKDLINTKEQLYSLERGGIINSYQISRYLQRFLAPISFSKGGNSVDLFKIIHYALFEVTRRKIHKLEKKVDLPS